LNPIKFKDISMGNNMAGFLGEDGKVYFSGNHTYFYPELF